MGPTPRAIKISVFGQMANNDKSPRRLSARIFPGKCLARQRDAAATPVSMGVRGLPRDRHPFLFECFLDLKGFEDGREKNCEVVFVVGYFGNSLS